VVGLGLLLQPIVAAAIGWVVFDERLGLPDLMGAAAIAGALVLVRQREE
jgi:drug/metabolite transporter (DMT)-like permease